MSDFFFLEVMFVIFISLLNSLLACFAAPVDTFN